MKRPDIAIKCLETGEMYGHYVSFMREAAAWINHLESQLQPRKTVDAHDCALSGNKVVGINEGTQAEGNGVTDDTEAVQAMLNKSQPHKTVSDDCEDDRWYDGKDWPEKEFEAEVELRKGEESIDKKAEWYAIEVNKLFTAAKKDGIKLTRTDHGTIWEVIKPPISKAEIEKLREYAKWTSKQESDFVCDLVEKFINEHEVK